MTKFKVGELVRVISDNMSNTYRGLIGKIEKLDLDSPHGKYYVKFTKDVVGNKDDVVWCYGVEKVNKRGRPRKEKQAQFIAIYDEEDGDPYKKFYTRKELLKWLKEAKDDENIIFDSIEVYPAGEMMKPKLSVRLKNC